MPIWIKLVFSPNFFESPTLIGLLKCLRSRRTKVGVEWPSTGTGLLAAPNEMNGYARRHPGEYVLGSDTLPVLVLHERKDNHLLIARKTFAWTELAEYRFQNERHTGWPNRGDGIKPSNDSRACLFGWSISNGTSIRVSLRRLPWIRRWARRRSRRGARRRRRRGSTRQMND